MLWIVSWNKNFELAVFGDVPIFDIPPPAQLNLPACFLKFGPKTEDNA
jgi:hypothetical protein